MGVMFPIFKKDRFLFLTFSTLGLVVGLLFNAGLQAQEASKPLTVGRSDHSVFKSVWVAVLEEAEIDFIEREARANIRRFWFVENDIQLDCCSIPEWRSRPMELATQIYTNPIFYSLQFFIHHEDTSIMYQQPSDLSLYRVAVIKGHTHMHEEHFGSSVEVDGFEELFKAIADGRADIASVNEQEFRFQMGRKAWPIVRGPIFHHLPLRARVRKEHADLVPRLNEAIARLKRSGRIDGLIGQAMRDEMSDVPE